MRQARAYIDELLPEVWKDASNLAGYSTARFGLEGVPDGYRAMNDREALKMLVKP